MKVLLTGSSGFIGRNFFKQYIGKYDFLCLDMKEDNDDIRKHTRDSSIEAVVHLGAYAGVRRSHEIPQQFWEMNVDGSRNIFNQYKDVPIIYASSSSIYEWWLSPYATTKKVVEEIAPPNSIGLRFHTVYGVDSRPDMLYDKMLKRKVEYITNHTRDWTHVEDVCEAIDICLDNIPKLKFHRAIDVGNGEPVSVKEMADKLWPGNNLPVREVTGEREHTCANSKELFNLGWNPKHHMLRDDHESV
jgi:nucleoside-diphosphate-sugar epimerase